MAQKIPRGSAENSLVVGDIHLHKSVEMESKGRGCVCPQTASNQLQLSQLPSAIPNACEHERQFIVPERKAGGHSLEVRPARVLKSMTERESAAEIFSPFKVFQTWASSDQIDPRQVGHREEVQQQFTQLIKLDVRSKLPVQIGKGSFLHF
jgi:hypothetical protein